MAEFEMVRYNSMTQEAPGIQRIALTESALLVSALRHVVRLYGEHSELSLTPRVSLASQRGRHKQPKDERAVHTILAVDRAQRS